MYNRVMFIGIDIGGTKILIADSKDGRRIDRSLHLDTAESAAESLAEIEHAVLELAGSQPIDAIGVACAGPLDLAKGLILNPPNIPWRQVKIVSFLRKRFDVPVALENDANSAGLAEATHGAGRGGRAVLYVTISTGIGTGLIVDGQAYHGAHDIEGGHIVIDANGPECSCGGRGHFEALVSGRAIKRRYGLYAYQIRDPKVWDEIAHDLSLGLISLINAYSPDTVVLGGGVSVHYPKFKRSLFKYLKNGHSLYPLPRLAQAKNVETAAVLGCFILAKREFEAQIRR